MDDKKQEVARLVAQPLIEHGFELADITLSQYKRNVMVRLFVYGRNGVSLGDCALLSRLVGGILDESELFPEGYALEVSSPGLDRPLKTARDFRYRIGETVKVVFADKTRSIVRGQIAAVTDDAVSLTTDAGEATFAVADIEKAQIVF
jgi:ribosome maturation factor RimP